MKKKLILMLSILGGLSFTAMSQTATPGVTTRQGVQDVRIDAGKATGELTRREARELERQQRRINRHKKAVKADGIVTKKERAGVKMHQNKANRDIRRKKHNGRDRG